MLSLGFRMQDFGFRVKVYGLVVKVLGPGCIGEDLVFEVLGLGFNI
jgi:hypothetical protein